MPMEQREQSEQKNKGRVKVKNKGLLTCNF